MARPDYDRNTAKPAGGDCIFRDGDFQTGEDCLDVVVVNFRPAFPV